MPLRSRLMFGFVARELARACRAGWSRARDACPKCLQVERIAALAAVLLITDH